MVRALAAAALGLSCNYGASFRDCTIACSAESGCPSGFSCGTEGLCRATGATNACGAASNDGGTDGGGILLGDAGAELPDTRLDITLSENNSLTAISGDSPSCSQTENVQTTGFEYEWFRAFSLSDYLAGAFHVTNVHYTSEQATGNATVTIKLASYTGAVGSATLDMSLMTQLAEVIEPVPNGTIQDLVAPIAADIPAGTAFVVEIDAEDKYVINGPETSSFHLGANVAGATQPSYWISCSSPTTGSEVHESSDDYIITVEGTAP